MAKRGTREQHERMKREMVKEHENWKEGSHPDCEKYGRINKGDYYDDDCQSTLNDDPYKYF